MDTKSVMSPAPGANKNTASTLSASGVATPALASGSGSVGGSMQLKKMRVKVCVRDKLFDVVCGDGTQQIRWLANVAIARYDTSNGFELGAPLGVRLEDGTALNMQHIVRERLKDGQQVFVVLKKGMSDSLRQRQTAAASAGVSASQAAVASAALGRTSGSAAAPAARKSCCARMSDWFWRPVSIDVRALAVIRVLYGILLIADTLMRWRDIRVHYTDSGVMPGMAYATEFQPSPYYFSLHLASGTLAWQNILFGCAVAAGGAMIAGYHTRLATFIAYVLLVSVQNRFVYICNKGDMLFRATFFWLLFLPLDATFSVDAALSDAEKYRIAPTAAAPSVDEKQPGEPDHDDNGKAKPRKAAAPAPATATETVTTLVCSAATIGFVLQVCYSYLFSGLLKTGPEWYPEGTASYYALSALEFVSPLGLRVRDMMTPATHKIASYTVLGLELISPVLVLSPLTPSFFRGLIVALLSALHIQFLFTMQFGLFQWMSLAALIPLVPSGVWDFAVRLIWGTDGRGSAVSAIRRGKGDLIIVVSDPASRVLARKFAAFCRVFGFVPNLYVSRDGAGAAGDSAPADWNVTEFQLPTNGGATGSSVTHTGYAAFVAIAERVPWIGWWIRNVFRWRSFRCIGTPLFRLIGWFIPLRRLAASSAFPNWNGRRSIRPSRTNSFLATLAILFVTYWNIGTVPWLVTGISQYSAIGLARLVQTGRVSAENAAWAQNHITHGLSVPEPVRYVAHATGMHQAWTMYAPSPYRSSSWLVIPGALLDGTPVDVRTATIGIEPSFDMPNHVADTYRNARWAKYESGLSGSSPESRRRLYGKYLCRSWNEGTSPIFGSVHAEILSNPAKRLATFDIYHVTSTASFPGEPITPAQAALASTGGLEIVKVWRHHCFDPVTLAKIKQKLEAASPLRGGLRPAKSGKRGRKAAAAAAAAAAQREQIRTVEEQKYDRSDRSAQPKKKRPSTQKKKQNKQNRRKTKESGRRTAEAQAAAAAAGGAATSTEGANSGAAPDKKKPTKKVKRKVQKKPATPTAPAAPAASPAPTATPAAAAAPAAAKPSETAKPTESTPAPKP